MIEILGPFLLLIGVGWSWRFFPSLPNSASVRLALGSVVLYVFLPALTFRALYLAPIDRELWAVPLVSACACLATLAPAWLIYRALGTPSAALGAMLYASAWCNATYLGLPVITGLFGESMQRIPILFDLFAMSPLLFTLGVSIGAHYGRDSGAKAALRLPALWAAVAGVALNMANVPVPEIFLSLCKIVGSAVAPMMIFSVGLALRVSSIRRVAWVAPALGIKLVLAPLIALGLGLALGLSPQTYAATVVEAAMPSMVLTLTFSDRFSLDSELLALAITVSTVASFFTIPLFLQFAQNH